MSEAVLGFAAELGDRPAIIAADRVLSWAALERSVSAYAALLAALGAGPGGRVAWMMPNRPEVLVLALAAQRIGAQVVALGSRSTADELAARLDLAAPAVVVADSATRELLAPLTSLRHGAVLVDVDDRAGAGAHPPPRTPGGRRPVAGDRLGAGASLLFTSGTTAAPKAALRTRGDPQLARAIADGFRIGRATRFLVSGPLYHSGPWTCSLMTLSRGGLVGMLERFEERRWLDVAVAHRMNSGFLTPTQLRRLVGQAGARPGPGPPLSHVVVSGESWDDDLKRAALGVFGEGFVECYGCTELGPMTVLPAGEFLAHPGSCGRVFDGVELASFAGPRRLRTGEVGTLWARTPLAFDGYLGASGHPPAGPGGDWATVGDLGYLDEQGYLHLAGRTDDMIITGGVNTFPADVEHVLAQHPDVLACAVFGLPDPDWTEVVAAAVVGRRPLELAEVRSWMRGRLSDDRRPRRLFLVDELPVTPTGKVSRRALRDAFAAQPDPAAGR